MKKEVKVMFKYINIWTADNRSETIRNVLQNGSSLFLIVVPGFIFGWLLNTFSKENEKYLGRLSVFRLSSCR